MIERLNEGKKQNGLKFAIDQVLRKHLKIAASPLGSSQIHTSKFVAYEVFLSEICYR